MLSLLSTLLSSISILGEPSNHFRGIYRIGDGNRDDIITYLQHKRSTSNSTFTVIDIGGSVNSWSVSVADAYVDINYPEATSPGLRFFRIDITDPSTWHPILDFVKIHGKFSFSICSHTLEDIANPVLTIRLLEAVSNAGYIAFPSKYRELSYAESQKYRGHIHHRWIFSVYDDTLLMFPKLGFLENNAVSDKIACIDPRIQDFNFLWSRQISYKIINEGYLGPSIPAVMGYYEQLLADDMDRKYRVKIVQGKLVGFDYHASEQESTSLNHFPDILSSISVGVSASDGRVHSGGVTSIEAVDDAMRLSELAVDATRKIESTSTDKSTAAETVSTTGASSSGAFSPELEVVSTSSVVDLPPPTATEAVVVSHELELESKSSAAATRPVPSSSPSSNSMPFRAGLELKQQLECTLKKADIPVNDT
jgi:hypothetical protein